MAEQVQGCPGGAGQCEGLCIHASKITDVCLDKDCIEDLRVYLTQEGQTILDESTGARARYAELLTANVNVEELSFQRGYHAVDLTFYYRVRGEATAGGSVASSIEGLAIFGKRVVLYGGESGPKIYTSQAAPEALQTGFSQLPEAVVEVIDPMVLSSRVVETAESAAREVTQVPQTVLDAFTQPLVMDNGARQLYLTIGQFSTIRLERDAQLTVPNGSFCIPQKSCCGEQGCQEDPCDMFSRIDFPYGTFYPGREPNE